MAKIVVDVLTPPVEDKNDNNNTSFGHLIARLSGRKIKHGIASFAVSLIHPPTGSPLRTDLLASSRLDKRETMSEEDLVSKSLMFASDATSDDRALALGTASMLGNTSMIQSYYSQVCTHLHTHKHGM